MGRELRTDTFVAGRWFAAGTTPPDDFARLITNSAAWEGEDPDMSEPGDHQGTRYVQPGETVWPEGRPGPNREGPDRPEPTPMPAPPAPGPEPGTEPGTEPSAQPPVDAPPPRSGKGSGTEAWERFARVNGVQLPADVDRAGVITACEQAGLVEPA